MYEVKDFKRLLGTEGFSDNLLNTHFGLYEGYVKNTNALAEQLKNLLAEGKTGPGEYAELKRRFGWEFNGMRLHELYFGNMSKEKKTLTEDAKVSDFIKKNYGSFEAWEKDFVATGALRGIGWAVLAYDQASATAFNVWINEHDVGHLTGATPLLVMDVFEHAFVLDYGMRRADYINRFMAAIDWDEVEKRVK